MNIYFTYWCINEDLNKARRIDTSLTTLNCCCQGVFTTSL